MKHKLLGYLYLLVVAVLTIGAVYLWQVPKSIGPTVAEQTNSTEIIGPVDTSGWKIYNDPKNRFQFLYPAEWKYSAFPEPESVGFAPEDEISDGYMNYHLAVSIVKEDSETWLKSLGEVGFVEKNWTENGYVAILVTDVPGQLPSNIALIYMDNLMLEFIDIGQAHTNDGKFQAILDSIR